MLKNSSLKSSLIPSETGCSNPNTVTLLGPSRIWVNPSSFRSNKVTKATPPIPNKVSTSRITNHNNILMCLSVFSI